MVCSEGEHLMGETASGGVGESSTMVDINDQSAVTQPIKEEAMAPHDLSITLVGAVAFLVPLATLLWALPGTTVYSDEYDTHHRHLQIVCNVTNSSIAQANAEEVSTIDAIRTTSIISASVAFLCLVGYELFRQDPIVGKYVYDRKRLTQPGRTPPPLMLSRSLWRGDEGESRSCCRVRPALLELIYINLDKVYVQYSQAADEARKERERRGHYTCCRTGCYHNNCCNTIRLGNACSADNEEAEEYYTDEDGYVFYAGYDNEYSHIYQGNKRSFSPQKKPRNLLSVSEASESEEVNLSPKWRNNIADLYPEDNNGTRNLLAALPEWKTDSGDSVGVEEEKDAINAAGEEESQGSISFLTANSAQSCETEGGKQESIPKQNDDTGNESDDPHEAPNESDSVRSEEGDTKAKSIVAESGDEDQLHANSALEQDGDMQRAKDKGCNEDTNTNGAYDDEAESPPTPRYPYRLKYLFMPPGFHTWETFAQFLGHFFFLQRIFPWFRKCHGDRESEAATPSVLHVNPGKELSEGEAQLLEYAGLDTYLLIRFARFGFDVTNYPFWAACVVVLPIYYSCRDPSQSDVYFGLTINEVPDGSYKIIPVIVFTILLYIYILRRLWIEWDVFIGLRHQYLANGDQSFYKSRRHQRKYRNSCLVECVPKSHRSDKNLNDVFDKLFPGQIESAEMFIDTSKLEDTLRERRRVIEKYDDIDARYRYQQWVYSVWEQKGKTPGCCNTKIAKPTEPQVRTGRFSREKEDAFDYYNGKIQEIDAMADSEYANIVSLRQKLVNVSLLEPKREASSTSQFSAHDIYQLFVPSTVRRMFGREAEFFYGTGVVTFKTIAAKQSAVQCNLSGLPYFMMTSDAPDPRDVFWSNVGVSRVTLENRKILVQFLLLLGVLAWGSIVTLIHSFTLQVFGTIPFGGVGASLVQGYLPALVVSLVLLWIPNLFFFLARHVIRFKSHTQCDEFTLLWNTAYRLANIFFTFFSISLLQAIQCLRENPDDFVVTLADGIIRQSAFLMNLIILATGQETMLQLLQWRSLIKQAVVRPLINVNARSRRYLDWLNAAPEFEKSFIFGFFAPVLSYGLMIAMTFAFMAPSMLGVCAVFFFVATKVHTHNALFVYCQRCEGGGKIFYYWSRIVFITLYCSVLIFAGILALKHYTTTGIVLFFILTLVVYCVDRAVKSTFVVHSLHLPISIARIHDDDEAAHLLEEAEESDAKLGGGEKFMYRHPILNQDNWNSKPTWS